MKCRQVASGGIYLDQEVKALVKLPKSEREWVDLHEAKLDALEELTEELQGSPLMVAYDFEHDLARLHERFGDATPHIGGGVDTKKVKKIEAAWNAGDIPLLLVQPASAAHGLNLQGACNHVAWHTLTWDFELYDQLIRRVRRQGQKEKRVFVHHIMASGTIDEVILMVLKSKDRGQQALFTALKSLGHRK
jgi:SNF2 family DNA or RNA helicase